MEDCSLDDSLLDEMLVVRGDEAELVGVEDFRGEVRERAVNDLEVLAAERANELVVDLLVLAVC